MSSLKSFISCLIAFVGISGIRFESTDIPTPVPVPAFPRNVDIFIQFSATGCPNPVNLDLQITVIQNLINASTYTFKENGIRAAVLIPFGMSVNYKIIYDSKENILQSIKTIEAFSKRPDFCSNGPTITHAFEDINDLLRIKANSSTVVILFSDSTDSTDISLAATYRRKIFDPFHIVVIPIALPGGAPLSELATNKSQTFKINEYNLGIKITDALAAAPTFLNGISP